jgi:hypothetical protein
MGMAQQYLGFAISYSWKETCEYVWRGCAGQGIWLAWRVGKDIKDEWDAGDHWDG